LEVKSYSIIGLGKGSRYKVWIRVLRNFLDLNILYILFETLNEVNVKIVSWDICTLINFAPIELVVE